jgi:hypothetical protein
MSFEWVVRVYGHVLEGRHFEDSDVENAVKAAQAVFREQRVRAAGQTRTRVRDGAHRKLGKTVADCMMAEIESASSDDGSGDDDPCIDDDPDASIASVSACWAEAAAAYDERAKLPERDKKSGKVHDFEGTWIGTVSYTFSRVNPSYRMFVLCKKHGCKKSAASTKGASEEGALAWLRDGASTGHSTQELHMGSFEKYVCKP